MKNRTAKRMSAISPSLTLAIAAKAKATPENIARVRRYARLGIANVNNAIDVKEALEMHPDILEV